MVGPMDARRLATICLFGPAALWVAVAAAGVTRAATAEALVVDRADAAVVRSDQCRRCHQGEYRTWHDSFHRTMTQRAVGGAVLGPFDGQTFEYLGFSATMTQREGVPHMHISRVGTPAAPVLDLDVVYTVGSHRYQQYVGRMEDGALYRLPVAWHLGEKRWIHMNGAFLEDEGIVGSESDYLRHLSRWNDNCVFCHNTEPVPGLTDAGTFETRLGEVGIACEACHGPAEHHLAAHAGPFERIVRGTLVPSGDSSIAQPGRLDAGLASDVCGRCHGQRIAASIRQVLTHGDGFLPGTALNRVSRPIYRHETLAGEPGHPFQARFWADGTPRLSAYEYQGLLLSPCHQDGDGLGCNDCHDMHGDDPDGQVREGRSGRGACIECHLTSDLSGAPDHGGHGDTVDCQGCHMPRTTYGLMQGLISHRITTPDPGAWIGRSDQPDACTQCHVDATRSWAAVTMADLGLGGTPATRAAPEEAWTSRVVLDLVGGDPIQRGLAAHALGREPAVGDLAWRAAALVLALEDEYPVVRFMAVQALRGLVSKLGHGQAERALAGFDYLGPATGRVSVVTKLRELLGPGPLDDAPERFDVLVGQREARAIWIGE